jgi:hypothetical protein
MSVLINTILTAADLMSRREQEKGTASYADVLKKERPRECAS